MHCSNNRPFFGTAKRALRPPVEQVTECSLFMDTKDNVAEARKCGFKAVKRLFLETVIRRADTSSDVTFLEVRVELQHVKTVVR